MNIEKTQKNLLILLSEIDQICKENDIDYCLAGGCLIGAVRNGGFLPWDDDADIHMTREDAEKFFSLKDKFPENRTIYSTEEYDGNRIPVCYRYVNTETTCITERILLRGYEAGQYVDILVLSEGASDTSGQKKQLKALHYLLELNIRNGIFRSDMDRSWIRNYRLLKLLSDNGMERPICRSLMRKAYRHEGEGTDYHLLATMLTSTHFIPKSLYWPTKEVLFDGYKFRIPERVEELLLYYYGSTWMYAPPAEEANTHTFISDPDIPYYIMDRENEKYIDGEQYYRVSCDVKDAWVKYLRNRNIVNPEIQKAKGVAFYLVTKRLVQREKKLRGNENTYSDRIRAKKIFDYYYNYQFSKTTRYWSLFEPMEDGILTDAMEVMVNSSDYSKCKKLIDLRRNHSNRPLTEAMEALEERCIYTQKCVDCFYVKKEYEECRKLVSEGLENYPNDISLLRLKAHIEWRDFEKDNSNDQVKNTIDTILRIDPNEGEALFFKAKLAYPSGNLLYVRDLLSRAENNTRHGKVLAESEEMIGKISEAVDGYIPPIASGMSGIKKQFIEKCQKAFYCDADYVKCNEYVEEGLARFDDDEDLTCLKVRLLNKSSLESGDRTEFYNYLESAAVKFPNNGQILVFVGLMHKEKDDLLRAKEAFTKVLTSTSNLYDLNTAQSNLDAIETLSKDFMSSVIDDTMDKNIDRCIDIAVLQQDYQEAKKLIKEDLNKYPFDLCLSRLLLHVLDKEAEQIADYESFDATVEQFVESFPHDPDILFYNAEKLRRRGDSEQALSIYQQVLATSDNATIKGKCLSELTAAKQVDNAFLEGEPEPYKRRQRIYETLLGEIHSICQDNGIDYYLADDGLCLLSTGRPIENNTKEICVIMLKDQFDKFQEAFSKEKRINRELEGLTNNSAMNGFHYRYVASNSLYMDIANPCAIRSFGYSINIYIPIDEEMGKSDKKKVRLIEWVFRDAECFMDSPWVKRIIHATAMRVRSLFSDTFANSAISTLEKNALKDTSHKSHVRFASGKKKVFSQDTFSNPTEVTLSGNTYKTFSDVDRYLSERYGKRGQRALFRDVETIEYDCICNVYVGYREFCEELKKRSLLGDSFTRTRKKMLTDKKRYEDLYEIKEKYVDVWHRNSDRLILWNHYKDKKDNIIHLWEQKKYTELGKILEPYIDLMIYYRDKGLGLCFDYDILRITTDVLRKTRQTNIPKWKIKEMERLVPVEHLHETITIC